MRPYLTAVFVLATFQAVSQAAWAQTPPPAPPAQQFDVPVNGKPQTVMIMTRDFKPGQSAGRHLHHGVEMTMVLHGTLRVTVDGQAPHDYHAGDSLIVPREVPHDAQNVGQDDAIIAITYVIDKGTPARVPVP